MSWSRKFDDPIPLPDGRTLRTLQDAADYMMQLSKADQELQHWKDAGEAAIMAAENRGPLMFADIGMRRALNFGKPKPVRKKRARKMKIIEHRG